MSPSSRRLRSPEPPRAIRILWAVAFGVAGVAGLWGVWLTVFADQPVRGSALLAVCLGAVAVFVSLRTWWLVQAVIEALAMVMFGSARATGVDAAESGPGFAAERSAAAGEGSGPRKRPTGKSGPKEGESR